MLEWFYACAVTKYQNLVEFYISGIHCPIPLIAACELNSILAILPILCILMRLLDGDSPCCAREILLFSKYKQKLPFCHTF